MPAKSTSKSKRPAPAKAKRPAQKSKVVTGKKQKPSKLRQVLSGKFGLLLAAIAIGVVGTYLLSHSHADSIAGVDNPARGVYYHGQRIKTAGTCVGQLDDPNPGTSDKNAPACTHPDPGPEGVDVRERDKHVDADLAKQAAFDAQHPASPSNGQGMDPPTLTSYNDVGAGGDLSAVSPRNWPCVGTGNDGDRVTMIYVYKSGYTNRLSTLRAGFEGVARRMNAIMYNSSVSNGTARQIRFQTNSSCSLVIYSAVMTAGNIDGFGTVKSALRAKGFNLSTHKYVVWIDAAEANNGCGIGDSWYDSSPGLTNDNNKGNMFAVIWHKCWNYSEPHEFMHTLGSVSTYYKDAKTGYVFSTNAPYNTPGGHCYDQHDIMCYNDGSGGHAMEVLCTNTVNIWRYDCNKNTYFNAGTPSGWLATHWNTANSSFLVR